jgi:hypothetical protein
VIHLRPLRPGARKVRDYQGLKEPWRAEPLYAPADVVAVFRRASLTPRSGREGPRFIKLRVPPKGPVPVTRPENT